MSPPDGRGQFFRIAIVKEPGDHVRAHLGRPAAATWRITRREGARHGVGQITVSVIAGILASWANACASGASVLDRPLG